jgi:hypothetical protein
VGAAMLYRSGLHRHSSSSSMAVSAWSSRGRSRWRARRTPATAHAAPSLIQRLASAAAKEAAARIPRQGALLQLPCTLLGGARHRRTHSWLALGPSCTLNCSACTRNGTACAEPALQRMQRRDQGSGPAVSGSCRAARCLFYPNPVQAAAVQAAAGEAHQERPVERPLRWLARLCKSRSSGRSQRASLAGRLPPRAPRSSLPRAPARRCWMSAAPAAQRCTLHAAPPSGRSPGAPPARKTDSDSL